MVEERSYAVRYIGNRMRTVPGLGVFQHGTVVCVPLAQAKRLIEDPDFSLAGWSHEPSRSRFSPDPEPRVKSRAEIPDWERALEDSNFDEEG